MYFCHINVITDCNGIDMTVNKKVLEEIIQPLTCNLSYQSGKFQKKMKIASYSTL